MNTIKPDCKEEKITVSIILLSLLRQEHTKRCMDSIFSCTSVPFEIIIIDMGMSSEIVSWLKELSDTNKKIRVLFNKENVGTARGRNQGIGMATGTYIVFLDNDAMVTEHWLEPLIAYMEHNQEVAACGSKILLKNESVQFCANYMKAALENDQVKEIGLQFMEMYHKDDHEVNHIQEVPWYPTTCLLVRKDVLEEFEGLDEKFFMCEEDKDLSLLIRRSGHKIFYIPQSHVYHYHSAPSILYQKMRTDREILFKDLAYFKTKWSCNVYIKSARSYLQKKGFRNHDIDTLKKFSFVNTVIEDELQITDLILAVTDRCNHACKMCYYHDSLNRNKNELSLDEYRRVSSALDNIKVLMISGGEPFLRDDLVDICKLFADNNNIESLFIPTNGSIPETVVTGVESILSMLPAVRLTMMLSLEGLQNTHDTMHGNTGAFHSVIKTIKTLNLLRFKKRQDHQSFSLFLNTVVTTQNIQEVIPLMDYIKHTVLVDSHTFTPMRGTGKESVHQPPSGENFRKLFDQAIPYFNFYAGRESVSEEHADFYLKWLNRRFDLWIDVLEGGKWPFICQAGKSIGVIEPDGDVRLCELKPSIGNIRETDYDFKKVWFSDEAEEIRASVKQCSCTHACFINASENQGKRKAYYSL